MRRHCLIRQAEPVGPCATESANGAPERLVRGAGLEPARYFYHEPLKLACLPVPPPALMAAYTKYMLRTNFQ
jgi:hypothetical protein